MQRNRLACALVLLVSAWAGSSTGVGQTASAAGNSQRTMAADMKSLVEAALDDAARRTKLDRARLEVLSAERVTWPDGSIGCPQPGVMYTQALVPGYRIRIRAGDEVLDYHAGRQGPPILCPRQRAVEPLPGGLT